MAAILVFESNEWAAMLLNQTSPVGVQLFSFVTLSFAMLVYQTNPVGDQLFSYVNTFFCHVVVPNQSCGSSTLFLCKHFLLINHIFISFFCSN